VEQPRRIYAPWQETRRINRWQHAQLNSQAGGCAWSGGGGKRKPDEAPFRAVVPECQASVCIVNGPTLQREAQGWVHEWCRFGPPPQPVWTLWRNVELWPLPGHEPATAWLYTSTPTTVLRALKYRAAVRTDVTCLCGTRMRVVRQRSTGVSEQHPASVFREDEEEAAFGPENGGNKSRRSVDVCAGPHRNPSRNTARL
jgi:hypothetical protein